MNAADPTIESKVVLLCISIVHDSDGTFGYFVKHALLARVRKCLESSPTTNAAAWKLHICCSSIQMGNVCCSFTALCGLCGACMDRSWQRAIFRNFTISFLRPLGVSMGVAPAILTVNKKFLEPTNRLYDLN